MSNDRKQIRDALVAILTAAAICPVYAGRDVDGRDEDEFANVYLARGASEQQVTHSTDEAELVIAYRNKEQLTDDVIDEKGDALIADISPQCLSDIGVRGIIYNGFEYLEDSSRDFSGIDFTYTVYY
jgi:hypothetical protein